MKPLLTLSLLILAPAILKADPLPKEAQDLLNKKQEAISNINSKLVTELGKVKIKAMKSGDLDGANAVDALIKEQKLLLDTNPANHTTPSKTPHRKIQFHAGMKLLWCPDAHRTAYFILDKGGKIRSLDAKTWKGSTADWKWESKAPGKITLTFSVGPTTMEQRKDSYILEGTDPSKKGSRARLVVVGFGEAK